MNYRRITVFLGVITLFTLTFFSISGSSSADGGSLMLEVVGYLEVEEGTVELKRTPTDIWVTIESESVIAKGDRVRTSIDGVARIIYNGSGGFSTVNPNSEVYIDHISMQEPGYDAALEIYNGTVFSDFTEAVKDNSRYEILTPNAYFVVTDGVLAVNVSMDGHTVAMAETGLTHAFDAGLSFELPEGHGIRIDSQGAPSEVLAVRSFAQMNALVDGVPFSVLSNVDMQFNVRRGPTRDNVMIGTIMPGEVSRVHGVSEDGQWYRVQHNGQ
jgi:hypothetical protein